MHGNYNVDIDAIIDGICDNIACDYLQIGTLHNPTRDYYLFGLTDVDALKLIRFFSYYFDHDILFEYARINSDEIQADEFLLRATITLLFAPIYHVF